MLRKDFIKVSSLSAIALPKILLAKYTETPSFEVLTGTTTAHLDSSGIMHKMAYRAYLDLRTAALKEGVDVRIVSGFRSFDRQLAIYNRKYMRYRNKGFTSLQAIQNIILYSTIPGTSRHHWGTDIDIIDANAQQPAGDVLNEAHYHGDGVFCKLKDWMDLRAAEFGFYLTYTANHHRTGFNYEPWHYSFRPLALKYLEQYLDIDITALIEESDIRGKSELTSTLLNSYMQSHVLGVNPELLP